MIERRAEINVTPPLHILIYIS